MLSFMELPATCRGAHEQFLPGFLFFFFFFGGGVLTILSMSYHVLSQSLA